MLLKVMDFHEVLLPQVGYFREQNILQNILRRIWGGLRRCTLLDTELERREWHPLFPASDFAPDAVRGSRILPPTPPSPGKLLLSADYIVWTDGLLKRDYSLEAKRIQHWGLMNPLHHPQHTSSFPSQGRRHPSVAIRVSDVLNNPCRTQRVNSPKTCSTLLPLGKSKGRSLLHSQSSRLPDPAVVSSLQVWPG